MPAGQHRIALTASTLSKGSVSDPNDNPVASYDDYVIVNVPLAAGEPASRRFFMLNSIGDMENFTLSAVGTVKLMFIDSDVTYNAGQATVRLDTTGPSATVGAMANIDRVEHGVLGDARLDHGQRPPPSRDAHGEHVVGRRWRWLRG